MVMRSVLFFIPGLIVLAVMASPAAGEAAPTFCHDPDRDTVIETAAALCRGRVVTGEEARAIRQRRTEHVRRALSEPHRAGPERRVAGIGTGFFVAQDGSILTNRHVVDNCGAIGIAATNGDYAVAEVKGFDAEFDLALVQSPITPPMVATLSPVREPSSAEPLNIVGFPAFGLAPLNPILVEGRYIKQTPSKENRGRLAIRADVRHGNSGGPVLDQMGQVVAVIYAKLNAPKIYSETKRPVPDIGIAIDQPTVRAFLDRMQVKYRMGGEPAGDLAAGALERARPFIVRVQCWR